MRFPARFATAIRPAGCQGSSVATMNEVSRAVFLGFSILMLVLVGPDLAAGAQNNSTKDVQLPAEVQGAKVYRLPDGDKSGKANENPIIYKSLAYQDLNFDRLVLRLSLAVKSVDRDATIQRIYFQDIRVNGVPVQVQAFEKEFKISRKDVVDLPAPLNCTIVFSDLDSLAPLKEIVNQEKLTVTGQSFLEVKLNALQRIAVRSKRLVLPVEVKQEVPLEMFTGNPWLKMAANGILDTLTDPSSEAAIALAKEHLAKISGDRVLEQKGNAALYFLYCEYALKDPKTGASERLYQSGTAFLTSSDGKLLTAKRVVEPWKFDPQTVLLISRDHLEVDPATVHLAAWPAGAALATSDGALDTQSALTTEKHTLKVIRTAPDRFAKEEYQDPDSGEKVTLELHARGENDIAILQATGANFQPLEFAGEDFKLDSTSNLMLMGFPFGSSQAHATPKSVPVSAKTQSEIVVLNQTLNPGQSGAPLVTGEGKVVALCSEPNQCIQVESLRKFIP